MAGPVRPRSFCISARSARRSCRRRKTALCRPRRFTSSITPPPGWGLPISSLSTRSAPASAAARASEENPDKPFWDVRADIASLGAVVRLWLTRHQRWTSPVCLVGESYGGFRAAAMARALPHDVDVTVRGLVLVSPALDLSALHPSERDLLAAGFFLPTYAATAARYDAAAGRRRTRGGRAVRPLGLSGRPGRAARAGRRRAIRLSPASPK